MAVDSTTEDKRLCPICDEPTEYDQLLVATGNRLDKYHTVALERGGFHVEVCEACGWWWPVNNEMVRCQKVADEAQEEVTEEEWEDEVGNILGERTP